MIIDTKKRYHPLVIILYANGMLSEQELNRIARTTKHNWKHFKHEDYYGYEWAMDYIEQFDEIKDVFRSKYTYRAIKTMLKTRRGYYEILGELTHNKDLMKLHAESIVSSVENLAQFSDITVKQACKFYGISKDWYYTQKQKIVCCLSPIKKCYRQHPNQLTIQEVTTIEHLIKKMEHLKKPLSTIYYQAMHQNVIACGLSSFRKYAKAFGHIRRKPKRVERKKGFAAAHVFEWLHVDITNVQTVKDGVQKVAFVKDNFSSALLHVKSVSGKAGSEFIAELLQETFDKHDLYNHKKDIHILSDGGSENKGEVLSWVKGIQAPPIVKKITAMSNEFPYSNSMSEITHSIYKTEFMGGQYAEDIIAHLKSLEAFMEYYNHHRYPCRLYGKTPMQIVNGEAIDKHLHTERIKQAKIDRAEANRNFNQCIARVGCKG